MLCVSLGVSHLDGSLEAVVVILACLEHNSTTQFFWLYLAKLAAVTVYLAVLVAVTFC